MSGCCSRCGQYGHSSNTCPKVKLRRSASTGHLRHHSWSDYRDGYVSEDLEYGRRPETGVPKKTVNSDRHTSSVQRYKRQYSSRETRKEIRSNLSDIVEETESPAFLLPGTSSNHESYSMRDGSDRKVNNTEDNTRSPAVSSDGTEYYSCMDTEELCEINSGFNEEHQRTNDSYKKVALKWIFVISNFFLEVLSAIFGQLSSPHTSFYALIALLAAFATIVICTIEIVYKGRQQKVTWGIRGKIYWFYHPSPSHKPFGALVDIFVLVCAFFQLISAAISYAFYCLHAHSPIKISLCSLAFAMCLLCCNFCNDHDKVALS